MKQQILHTPEGVRDIYGTEYKKKLVLEEKLQSVLHLYGYQDIQTPMFEYFDVFGKEVGTIPSRELYKFFDKDGNTLVLRPDITPSIARVATTVCETDCMPLRLCYKGNTFINHSNYKGRLREHTQLGAELIGVESAEADAEMIAMAVEGLKEAGLLDFQIHIGNVDFFEGLIAETGLNEDDEQHLRELIKNRNYFGVDELLARCQAKVTTKTAFQILPELVGGAEVLKSAKKVALNAKVMAAVKRLEQIYEILESYGVEKHVSFDLSMSGTYGYYTGVIFRGYTYGTGDAVVKGGRYDNLLGKFGKAMPSIGFAIVVDELLSAFDRQKVKIACESRSTFILYEEGRVADAIVLAKEFRSNKKETALAKRCSEKSIEDYIAYARQNHCVNMLYLKAGEEIVMIQPATGKKKLVTKKTK
ncbi:MAG: ATP phosphoribosyltransferase regulatory subunit [Faecalimonas sp.]|nr:ATP phosphoribosyltransferase regulatory subunit [Faecalimonas sp.]